MAVIWVSVSVAVSGLLAIWFAFRQLDRGYSLFKPLTTSLILVLVFLGPGKVTLYDGLIGAGLVFSILGDILLMLPSDRFLAGMGAFLITHLLYISAFSAGLSELFWEPSLPILGLAFLAILLLGRNMKGMRYPVYLYIAVISAMAWTAWSRWMGTAETGSLLAACGAALFLFSDLILALNRFKSGFRSAQAVNLLSYYTAQLLIAFSAVIRV